MQSNYVKRNVTNAYRKVTDSGILDVEAGNKPINNEDKLCKVPSKYHTYVDETGKGCCLLFATYMLEELHKKGIESYIILTKEDNGIRGSLLYQDGMEYFVANPVEDIEFFTKSKITDRAAFYKENGSTFIESEDIVHDNSRIPLQDFADRYGIVKYLTNYYEDNIETFGEAMSRANSDEMILATPTEKKQLVK